MSRNQTFGERHMIPYKAPFNADAEAADRIIKASRHKKIRVMGPMDFSAKRLPVEFSAWKTQSKEKR